MAYTTIRDPEWLKWIAPEKFCDQELFRIVTFFVFHSPCQDLSSMSSPLSEYGWQYPWRKPHYLNRHLRQAASKFNLIYSAPSYDKMDEALKKAGLRDNFPQPPYEECVCIYDNKQNQFMSVFYHIRNAFAHGRLNMVDVAGDCIFILEDVQTNKKQIQVKVSARMILKKSTLLKWIEIIEGGEREYHRNISEN